MVHFGPESHSCGPYDCPVNFNSITAISWDVDGTLYSLPAMASVLAWLSIKYVLSTGVRRTTAECRVLREFRKRMSGIRAAGGVLPSNGSRKATSSQLSIERRWYGEAIRRVGVRKGLREALDNFRKAGLIQVVVSDYECSYKLSALELEDVFDGVFSGETIGYVKPSPKLFIAVAQELRIKPEQLLHIGDRRDRDGIAAAEAGCKVLILREDFRSFSDLMTYVRC